MKRLSSLAVVAMVALSAAAPMPPDLFSGLVWRNVGPFRGGRISAASGAIGVPGTFYVGLPAAGVWKTTSAGETWYPVFDAVPAVSSIGAIAVAPSSANVVYVGTGDLITGGVINEGNGVYVSEDAGQTWRHLGLDRTKQIPSILVDPRDPNMVLVAAQGDIHAKSDWRGVFRSTNGGASWARTLFVNDSTGIQKLAIAHDRPDVVFATTVLHYVAPPPPSGVVPFNVGPPPPGPTATAIFKSIDGGASWKQVAGQGLPRLVGKTSIAVAMNTNAQRVYLITNDGLFRSDDGGANWRQMDPTDKRIRNGQGGYNCGVFVDPRDPNVVITFNTAAYRSLDGGETFTGFKGAPGGDDPQQGWIDPTDGDRILLGYDQGAIVSLDGGTTWSSWYNQSTEQVYHVATDNSFPYWIYATQQDAGAIRTRSRGNLGAITPLDWGPVNGWEWGTVLPDPLDPNIVYASGNGINRISYPSEQWMSVSPAANSALGLRTSSSQPLVWAPWDQHELITGFQYVMTTMDGGVHWKRISADLTYPAGVTPPPDSATPKPSDPPRGAIESISASTVAKGTIWVGTTNGLIKVTRDHGKTWTDATIPRLPYPARALIETVDASHTDAAAAYAVVDLLRSGDYTPYIFRTRDYGKSWTRITNGLPVGEPGGSVVRVVRADTKRAGLLFAGTETGVYVSFDDGDDWQSLQRNLPVTSYRDIAIKGNDLIVGSYGRGIWVLDDFAVLRQLTPAIARESLHLFKPDPAVRVRRNVGYDTPFPPEVPHALNPPDGAIIYYWLQAKPAGALTIEVSDAAGNVLRHLSSVAAAPVKEAAQPPHPNFWVAQPFALPADAGTNRTAWDLRTDAPPAFTHGFNINANPGLTPPSPEGGLVPPGTYTITLTVDGQRQSRAVTVTNDPRSPASDRDVGAQFALVSKIQGAMGAAWLAYWQADSMRAALAKFMPSDTASAPARAIIAFRARLDSVAGNPAAMRPFFGLGGGRRRPHDLVALAGDLASQLDAQEKGDLAPTDAMRLGFMETCGALTRQLAQWARINATDVPTLNVILRRGDGAGVTPAAATAAPKC